MAQKLAAMPTRGLGLTKRGFEAGAASTLDAQLDREEALQRAAGRTADYAEGVRAFVEKRKPLLVAGMTSTIALPKRVLYRGCTR